MSLIDYYSPFKEIEDFRRSANRIFGFDNNASSVTTPAVDIMETDEEFIFELDLPGFTKDQIEIAAAADSLSIKAERTREEESEDDSRRFIKRERQSFKFARTFNFAKPIDPEGAEVKLSNGVLNIRLPKSEEVKPKKLMITEAE